MTNNKDEGISYALGLIRNRISAATKNLALVTDTMWNLKQLSLRIQQQKIQQDLVYEDPDLLGLTRDNIADSLNALMKAQMNLIDFVKEQKEVYKVAEEMEGESFGERFAGNQ